MKAKKLILFLLFLFIVPVFSACPSARNNSDATVTIMIFTDNTLGFSKTVTSKHAKLLDLLKDTEELEIATSSSMGEAYLIDVIAVTKTDEADLVVAIGNGRNTYIALYHDINDAKYRDYSEYSADFIYDEATYFYSGVGVSALPVIDGKTYVLRQVTFG